MLLDDSLGTLARRGRRRPTGLRQRPPVPSLRPRGGVAELLVMLAGPFFGLPLPLLAAQILWINLLTHGLPGVALGVEPGEPGTMTKRPRSPAEGVLGDHLWRQVLVLGAWLAAVCLSIGLWAESSGRPWQSMIFVLLGLIQLGVAVGLRSRPGRYDRDANPMLLVAVVLAAALQIAAVYAPPLQALLSTEALSSSDLLVVLGAGSLGYVSVLIARVAGRRQGPRTIRLDDPLSPLLGEDGSFDPAWLDPFGRKFGGDEVERIMSENGDYRVTVGVDGSASSLEAVR